MTIAQGLKKRKRVIVCIKSVLVKLARDLCIDPVDVRYCVKRLQSEGLPFVTKLLPKFSSYALSCCAAEALLDCRDVGLTAFQLKGRSPLFMRGLLLEAIGGNTSSLYKIRQFCEYFYKTCFGFSQEDLKHAENSYIAVDEEYDPKKIDWEFVEQVENTFHNGFPVTSKLVLSDLFTLVRPHDGPGAFALSDRVWPGGNPSEYKKLPAERIGLTDGRLAHVSGYSKAYPRSPERGRCLVHSEKTAELRFVPKDSRGPRTISKVPLHWLRAQMGAGKALASALEAESNRHINFSEQTVNRELARVASLTGIFATLDLEKASDRVWRSVIRRISRYSPVLRCILKLISDHVVTPSGRKIKLNKFANMGSGVCFPVLSLLVYLVAVTSLRTYAGYSLKKAMSQVWTYGDDLIVETKMVEAVTKGLTACGLVVNTTKSYFTGYFRESCGGDYYHGIDVSPVRLRLPGSDLGTVSEYRNGFVPIETDAGITQIEAHCRELIDKGCSELASYYYSILERRLGHLPPVSLDSPYLGRYSPNLLVYPVPDKVYVTDVKNTWSDDVCPIKGLGRALGTDRGLGQDWCLTPLRRHIVLKRRVPDRSKVEMYGLPDDPRDAFDLRTRNRFESTYATCAISADPYGLRDYFFLK